LVGVEVRVGVWVEVCETVGVRVSVGVRVMVGVSVGVNVITPVPVGVMVGVKVGVSVSVLVGVSDNTCNRAGFLSGAARTVPPATAPNKQPARSTVIETRRRIFLSRNITRVRPPGNDNTRGRRMERHPHLIIPFKEFEGLAGFNHQFNGCTDFVFYLHIHKLRHTNYVNFVTFEVADCQYECFDGLVDRPRSNCLHFGSFVFADDPRDCPGDSRGSGGCRYLDYIHRVSPLSK